jgi:tripartite-type tricarboxylate transporter receptor subunit TctC
MPRRLIGEARTTGGKEGMRASIRGVSVAVVAAVAASASLAAAAQEYPAREIRSICNFAPGSGADIYVRFFSDKLAKLAGKPVVVENRPGANGNIATDLVAKAKPDGYTINITPASSTLAAAPHLFKQLPFDPLKDLVPVTTVAKLSFAIAVDGKSPIKTITELTEALKKKPGNGFYGTGNNTGLVSAELYKDRAGLKTTHVQYQASGTALQDLTSGSVDFISYDASFLAGHARSGRVRVLATTSAQRALGMPDVPTMAESGFRDFDLTPWWGVVVPAGTPEPIVKQLEAWFNRIAADEETRNFLVPLGAEPFVGSREIMTKLIRTESERWGGYVKIANIQPQ